jgi:hypothetical protein
MDETKGADLRRALTAAALAVAGVLMMVATPSAQAAVASSTVVSVPPITTTVGFTASPPRLSYFSPNKGPMGAKVTITGSGFAGTSKVTFHGALASFKVVSSTRITAIVPCGTTTGRIRVSTPKGTATSVGSFKIT